jgi:uncharacterized protein YecE (DUF72 family)
MRIVWLSITVLLQPGRCDNHRVGGKLHLGTSGFAYEQWRGLFYPPKLSPRRMLAHYAGRLSSVEINYSFRRFPTEASVATWRRDTPEDFTFSVKAHRSITHRAAVSPDLVAPFVERVAGLGSRLGPILLQFPPTLDYEEPRLEAILSSLPAGRLYAFEFRHPSWGAAAERVSAAGVAWCIAETDESAPDEIESGPFAYFRLRKSAYSEEELVRWSLRLGDVLRSGRDVYCYFKHEDGALGPRYAERVAELTAPAVA